MDWILKYWIQELFALVIAVLTWCVRKLRKKKTEYDVLREGILALLHDRLYQACSFFIARGWATLASWGYGDHVERFFQRFHCPEVV